MLLDLIIIAAAVGAGGILKGATGAGAPVVAVPIIALIFDVQTAVTVFAIPNILVNGWQLWTFRGHQFHLSLLGQFVLSAALGAGIGTVMLKELPGDLLGAMVAVVVLTYVSFRLFNPHWQLSRRLGTLFATPAGVVAGILQGASGISAPVSITFLNAMKPTRAQFVASISACFLAMSLVQLPMMIGFGLMTSQRFVMSLLALIPLFAFMPLGGLLVKRVAPQTFDWIILALLSVLSSRLLFTAIFG